MVKSSLLINLHQNKLLCWNMNNLYSPTIIIKLQNEKQKIVIFTDLKKLFKQFQEQLNLKTKNIYKKYLMIETLFKISKEIPSNEYHPIKESPEIKWTMNWLNRALLYTSILPSSPSLLQKLFKKDLFSIIMKSMA